MTPREQSLNASLRNLLSMRGTLTALELSALMAISQPTLSRLIHKTEGIVRIGKARSSRYGLIKNIRNEGHRWPIYRIDELGIPLYLGELVALQNREFYWNFVNPRGQSEGVVPENDYSYLTSGEFKLGLYPDLPWFFEDIRPQGYMGRAFARKRGRDLRLDSNPLNWNSEDCLVAILDYGSDAPGCFLLGHRAIEAFQALKPGFSGIPFCDRSASYNEAVQRIIDEGELPQSSAGGEQPKFTAFVERKDGSCYHAIVKFSGSLSTEQGRRWRDLLIAEDAAAVILKEHDLPSAQTRILEDSTSSHTQDALERTYLEVERFDRTGQFGRIGICSMRSLCAAFTGSIDQPWPVSARDLHRDGWLSPKDVIRLERLYWFGTLIGNTDMHYGNISFFLTPERPLGLCPCYDMLPMAYAPDQFSLDEMKHPAIRPGMPRPESITVWKQAATIAENYWDNLTRDDRLSNDFRKISQQNRSAIKSMRKMFS